jgi:syntaxin 16
MSEERQGLMSSGAYEDDGDAVIEMDLLPPRWLDVQDVKKREEREIEQLTQEITRGFQRCQQAIKRIETMVREAKQQGNINQGEEVMAQNLKISLATRVGEVSAMFRKKQSAYLKSEWSVQAL